MVWVKVIGNVKMLSVFKNKHHRFAVDYADFLSSGTLSLWLSCKNESVFEKGK